MTCTSSIASSSSENDSNGTDYLLLKGNTRTGLNVQRPSVAVTSTSNMNCDMHRNHHQHHHHRHRHRNGHRALNFATFTHMLMYFSFNYLCFFQHLVDELLTLDVIIVAITIIICSVHCCLLRCKPQILIRGFMFWLRLTHSQPAHSLLTAAFKSK